MKTATISNPFSITTSDETKVERRDALIERIMPAAVYRGTFNTIVAAALASLAPEAMIVVNTADKTVTVAVASAALSAAMEDYSYPSGGTPLHRQVEPTDPESRSAGIVVKELTLPDTVGDIVTSGVSVPEGQSAFDAALDASLGAQDTAKSLGSLADAIADAIEAQERHGIIVFDQFGQTCRFYSWLNSGGIDLGSTFAAAILNGAESGSVLATFHAEPIVSAGPTGFFGV